MPADPSVLTLDNRKNYPPSGVRTSLHEAEPWATVRAVTLAERSGEAECNDEKMGGSFDLEPRPRLLFFRGRFDAALDAEDQAGVRAKLNPRVNTSGFAVAPVSQ